MTIQQGPNGRKLSFYLVLPAHSHPGPHRMPLGATRAQSSSRHITFAPQRPSQELMPYQPPETSEQMQELPSS